MAAAVKEKRCKACGTDVSQTKRTKDSAGNYYCEACVQAARSSTAPPAPRTCGNCGATAGALQQLVNWEGHRVCVNCRDALQREAEVREEQQQEADNAAAQKVTEQQDEAQVAFRAERSRQRAALRVVTWPALAPLAAVGGWAVSPIFGIAMVGGSALACWGLLKRYRALRGTADAQFVTDFRNALGLLRQRFPVVLAGTMLSVALLAMFIAAALASDKYGITGAWAAGGVALIPVIIAGLFLQNALGKECPLCWTQGAAVFDGVIDLGTVAVTTRTYETSSVYKGLNRYGLPDATIKTPVERTRYVRRQAQNWHCTACGHKWSK